MKITIAFPSRGYCQPEFVASLRLLDIPTDDYFVDFVSGADVATARNILAERAMMISDYILFLDDDIIPPTDTLKRLLSHQKDFVSALCFGRRHPFAPNIYEKVSKGKYEIIERYESGKLIEVDAVGGACMLIKTKVFQSLKKPYFWYIPENEEIGEKGEDIYFCEKMKEAGYRIYCDTSIICKHIGKTIIDEKKWEQILENKKKL